MRIYGMVNLAIITGFEKHHFNNYEHWHGVLSNLNIFRARTKFNEKNSYPFYTF